MANSRCSSPALTLVLAMACSPRESTPPPLPAASGGNAETDSDGRIPIDLPPDPCALDQADSDAGDETTADTAHGFKFDVGAPEGSIGFSLDCDDVAEVHSNLGCSFWAVDLANDEQGTLISPPAADQPFAVVIANVSALVDANIEVFVGGDSTSIAAGAVSPGQTRVFDLGAASIPASASSVSGVAFRIESDVPVAAYQFNPAANLVEVYSNDASLLWPEQALGTDYTATTADGILLGSSSADPDPINAGAFVTVVATVEHTTVEFMPTADLVGSMPEVVSLDRGQVATLISDAQSGGAGDLSGTEVHADHPVAVFSGNVATAIFAEGDVCCADHLEHQLLPNTAWGTRYAVAPPPHPAGSGDARALYRLIGGPRRAELTYCPTRPAGAPTSLGAGEVASFSTDQPFTLASGEDGQSFSLTQFTLSTTLLGDSGLGDPAMIVVVPTGQHELRSVFAVPAGYAANWATIVTRGDGDVRIDGVLVDPDNFRDLGVLDGVEHRYAHLPMTAGSHALEAQAPAGVSVIGVDEAVGYGFVGGSGARVLSVPTVAQ